MGVGDVGVQRDFVVSCDDNLVLGFDSIEEAKEGSEVFFPAIARKIAGKDEDIRLYAFLS